MTGYTSIARASETEYIVERSRFIGRCFPAKSEAEALAFLAEIRKKHFDASHNCFAYRAGQSEAALAARFSDDGEPGGTAGLPIMEVLQKSGVSDAIIVVTRYFGGILLGAGGLVRAYTRSAADALSAAGRREFIPGVETRLSVPYDRYSAVDAVVKQFCGECEADFGAEVVLSAAVTEEAREKFMKAVIERTDGRVRPEFGKEKYVVR